MTTSDDRSLDPASIASASFTTTRRGFDPNEVRAYLQRLARQSRRGRSGRRRLATSSRRWGHAGRGPSSTRPPSRAWLGEEAARVLTTARRGAAQLRAKAEEHADQLRDEVHAEDGRAAAAEASATRPACARRWTPRWRGAARSRIAEAEAEIESARQEGRSMVSEARAVRERMLADLSRRRDGARAQLAALRGERDRIVNAIEATRDHLDRLMDDLRAASPDDDRELPPCPTTTSARHAGEPRLTLVRPLHPVHQEREPHETRTRRLARRRRRARRGPRRRARVARATTPTSRWTWPPTTTAIGEPELGDADPVFGECRRGPRLRGDARPTADVEADVEAERRRRRGARRPEDRPDAEATRQPVELAGDAGRGSRRADALRPEAIRRARSSTSTSRWRRPTRGRRSCGPRWRAC